MGRHETFADRLDKARRKRFASQEELAKELGVRPGTVSGWMNGAWPNEESMRALVRALGVSAHWLVTGDGSMRPSDGEEGARLQVIGKIADGQISPETLRRLVSDEAMAEEIADSAAKGRGSDPTAEAGP